MVKLLLPKSRTPQSLFETMAKLTSYTLAAILPIALITPFVFKFLSPYLPKMLQNADSDHRPFVVILAFYVPTAAIVAARVLYQKVRSTIRPFHVETAGQLLEMEFDNILRYQDEEHVRKARHYMDHSEYEARYLGGRLGILRTFIEFLLADVKSAVEMSTGSRDIRVSLYHKCKDSTEDLVAMATTQFGRSLSNMPKFTRASTDGSILYEGYCGYTYQTGLPISGNGAWFDRNKMFYKETQVRGRNRSTICIPVRETGNRDVSYVLCIDSDNPFDFWLTAEKTIAISRVFYKLTRIILRYCDSVANHSK